MSARIDPTAMSYWLPKLEAAGLPVPRTKLFKMPADVQQEIWGAFDGEPGSGRIAEFAKEVAVLAADFAFPIFLRTDHTSGKHEWKRTCFVERAADIASHIVTIAEYSDMADMVGLPWDNWAIREMLPTIPLAVCTSFGDMPVCREFRFFVENDVVLCVHPYWPAKALQQGGVGPDAMYFYDALCRMDDAAPDIHRLASSAGTAVGGAWSVDILETRRGWFITDMAEAHKSFHWDGCPMADIIRRVAGQ